MARWLWISNWLIILTFLLSSCTTITAPKYNITISQQKRETLLQQIQHWQLTGKIALLTAADSGSANVTWIQQQQRFTLTLTGPLGINGLKLSGEPGHVILITANGKQYTAHNPEELLHQQWGWQLPVSYLSYWVRGLPVPTMIKNQAWDASGRLSRLQQANCDIQYLSYVSAPLAPYGMIDLPNKISITSPGVKIKIVIYDWQLT